MSGNVNFAQTKYGIESKNNPTRVAPQPAAQLAQQARVKKAAAAYALLTGAQNTAWQTYALNRPVKAKSGEKVSPSAYAAFFGTVTTA